MYNNIFGSRYDGNLNIKDIAKLVKKEASKKYPNCKISARTKNYDAIWVTVKLNETEYNAEQQQEIKKDITIMLESYNYDRSDVMTDYFDYNFYGFVDIEYI